MPITTGDKYTTFFLLSTNSVLRSGVEGANDSQDFKLRLKTALVPLLNITDQEFNDEIQNGDWTGINNILTTGADGKQYITTDSTLLAEEVTGYGGGGSCPKDAMQTTIAALLKAIP